MAIAVRKANLMMLLAVVSSSAAAEWVEVGSSETSTLYADPTTIRRAGNLVKMWNLIDSKTPMKLRGMPYLSSRVQQQYDCKEEQWRAVYLSFFAGNMGNGPLLFDNSDPDKWSPVPPGGGHEILWKIACAKR